MFGGDDDDDLFGAFETATPEEGLKRPAGASVAASDAPASKRPREAAVPPPSAAQKPQLGGVAASVQASAPVG